MALNFQPYPIPPEEPTPVAQLADKAILALGAFGKYKQQNELLNQQKEALAQQKEQTRQEAVLNLLKFRGEYVDPTEADRIMSTYGLTMPTATAVPGAIPGAIPGPVQGPALPGAAPLPGAGVFGPAPAAPATAAPGGDLLSWTPDDALARAMKSPTYKGREKGLSEASAMMGIQKGKIDIEQNTPATPDQVRASLSVFGQPGNEAAEKLIASSPNGIPRTILGNTQSALSNMTRLGATSQPKAPPGFRWTAQGNLEAIPGGPAGIKIEGQEQKAKAMQSAMIAQADTVIAKAEQALLKVNNATTGIGGSIMGMIPGTEATDLRADVTTIKANLGFNTLQEMRRNSPTGGALGQVAVQELEMLQATVAALDQKQSKEQLRERLGEVISHYRKWKEAVEKAESESGQATGVPTPAPDADNDPLGIRGL